MGCNAKRHDYSQIGWRPGASNDVSMEEMARRGNEAIEGLMFKDVAVKRRRCH